MSNWDREIAKFAPTLQAIPAMGDSAVASYWDQQEIKPKSKREIAFAYGQGIAEYFKKEGETQGIKIVGFTNVAGRVAASASSLYARNLFSFIETLVDKASKAAPAGSDAGFNALRSTVAATTAAFDQFQKASKQVVNLADASMRAAAANASKAAPKGRRAA